MTTEDVGLILKEDGRVATRTPDELMTFAKKVAQMPDWCPQAYRGKPAAIVMAWEHGAELGFSRLQSLSAIAVVNGRPAIYGEAGTALVMERGLVSSYREWFEGEDDEKTARVEIGRKGVEGKFTGEFSVADAKAAGLWGRNVWKSYPKDMLLWKARWRAYRTGFADHLKGLVFREALEDYAEGPRDVSDTVIPADDIAPLPEGEQRAGESIGRLSTLPAGTDESSTSTGGPSEETSIPDEDNPFAGHNDEGLYDG